MSFEEISSEQLSNIADKIVDSKSELQNAFNNLSEGETVYVGRPATPYRTGQWLDIEVDDATIVFQSKYAENGEPIVKVADGAEVGGIRIGNSGTTREGIDIIGFGFHGNKNNQTKTGVAYDGIRVQNGKHITIDNCYITLTYPFEVHGGGSGISLYTGTSWCVVKNCYIDTPGDRGIENGGDRNRIINNKTYNTYDRGISLDESRQDGSVYSSSNTIVANNLVDTTKAGTGIAGSEYTKAIIKGNEIINPLRQGIHTAGATYVNVVGNLIDSPDDHGIKLFDVNGSFVARINIQGNLLVNISLAGIQLSSSTNAGVYRTNIVGNYIEGAGHAIWLYGGGKNIRDVSVSSNYIKSPSTNGIKLGGDSATGGYVQRTNVSDNYVFDVGGDGYAVHLDVNVIDALIKGNYLYSGNVGVDGVIEEGSGVDNNLIKGNQISVNDVVVSTAGANTVVEKNRGYVTENQGTSTQSGDGTTTVFTIAHGLDETPTIANVWAESADANGDFYVSNKDSSNIEITYASAPASGTNNLTWGFEARVVA